MTGYEFGDVILVPFPFTDQSTSKRRPAVVVSSNAYQRERPDLIILAITSQVRPQASLGEAAVAKWKEAGLLRPSVLKPVVATLTTNLSVPFSTTARTSTHLSPSASGSTIPYDVPTTAPRISSPSPLNILPR